MNDAFRRLAARISTWVGSPWAFFFSIFVIIVWAITGPLFHFSDTWQLVINTGTTIITFLMVFLIQNTQNRDARAIHLKLDELIRSHKGARTSLVDLEELSDEEMDMLQKEFQRLRERHHKLVEKLGERGKDFDEALVETALEEEISESVEKIKTVEPKKTGKKKTGKA